MTKFTAADTIELSMTERIQLVEDIWDMIAEKSELLELTIEEKAIIDERLKSHHENPEQGSPWKDVYNRVTGRQ